MRACCLVVVLLPGIAMACKCVAGEGSVCSSLAASEVAFIGTVESIDPAASPWDPAVAARLQRMIPESLLADRTPAGVARLKRAYLQALPDLPARFKRELESVATWAEFDAFWERVSEEGLRARFRIQEVFRGSVQGTADVWTALHDCGIPFQRGETYLVYANPSKKGGRLETSVCDRTTRVSDAGEDLTYLYFVRHGGPAASRLYGFVTTAESDVRTPRVGEGVSKPEPGVVVRVESRQKIRTDITDAKGRFVFDGLEAGDYRVSVFDEMGDELPRTAPQLVQVAANSCSSRVLLVPKRAAPK